MAGSGYNQDSNQITPAEYRVTLTMNTTNYPTGNAATTNGGVNPYDWNNSVFVTVPSSTVNATNLARGNLRWEAVLEQLYLIGDARVKNVSVTSGGTTDANQQPTAISFTVQYDRDAFILPEYSLIQKAAGASANGTYTSNGASVTAYNGNDGSTSINSTALALQDLITTGLVRGGSSGYTKQYRTYNIVTTSDSMAAVTITQPCTPATAFGTVAVTQISGTTLSGTPL